MKVFAVFFALVASAAAFAPMPSSTGLAAQHQTRLYGYGTSSFYCLERRETLFFFGERKPIFCCVLSDFFLL